MFVCVLLELLSELFIMGKLKDRFITKMACDLYDLILSSSLERTENLHNTTTFVEQNLNESKQM